MSRRSFLKKLVRYLITLLGLSGGTYYYARNIEPSLLKINHENILLPSIPQSFHNFKIVQFSDTHIGFQYSLKQLNDLVAKINNLNPNIIVFTGDLIDEPQSYRSPEKLSHILQKLKATDGKLWIYGNHDHGGYGTEIVQNIMSQADFKLLKNNHTTIERDHERIIIAGVDDLILGKPNLKNALN